MSCVVEFDDPDLLAGAEQLGNICVCHCLKIVQLQNGEVDKRGSAAKKVFKRVVICTHVKSQTAQLLMHSKQIIQSRRSHTRERGIATAGFAKVVNSEFATLPTDGQEFHFGLQREIGHNNIEHGVYNL